MIKKRKTPETSFFVAPRREKKQQREDVQAVAQMFLKRKEAQSKQAALECFRESCANLPGSVLWELKDVRESRLTPAEIRHFAGLYGRPLLNMLGNTKSSFSQEELKHVCAYLRAYADASPPEWKTKVAALVQQRCRLGTGNELSDLIQPLHQLRIGIPDAESDEEAKNAERKVDKEAAKGGERKLDKIYLDPLYSKLYNKHPKWFFSELESQPPSGDIRKTMCSWLEKRYTSLEDLLDVLARESKTYSLVELEKMCLTDHKFHELCPLLLDHPCLVRHTPERFYAPTGPGFEMAQARWHARQPVKE